MFIQGIRCDACSKLYQFPPGPKTQRDYNNMPPEWITVFKGPLEGQEGYNFCSVPCLNEWTAKQLIQIMPQEVKR